MENVNMRKKILPNKVCKYVLCKKEYNRTAIKNVKSFRKTESVCTYGKRKYCSRKCYILARMKPIIELNRCMFCSKIIFERKRDNKSKKLIGSKIFQKQKFCNREHYFLFWEKYKGVKGVYKLFQKAEKRYSVSRKRANL